MALFMLKKTTPRLAASPTAAQALTPLQTQKHQQNETYLLLAVLAIIAGHLSLLVPLWVGIFSAALLLWRALLAYQLRPLPRPLTLGLVLAAVVIGCAAQAIQGPVSGAALTLLVLLIPLKLLELRSQRDLFALFFLGFFGIVANFLFVQSILVAALMLTAFMGLVTVLVCAQMPLTTPKPLRTAAKTAGQLLLWGMPIIVVLYLAFPRFAPLWGIPSTQNSGKTGLSESMNVGTMASLAQDQSVALRIRFTNGSQAPKQSALYFRGPVLSRLEGNRWLSDITAPANFNMAAGSVPNPLQGQGRTLEYEVLLQANEQHWLLALDGTQAPPQMDEAVYMTQSAVWQTWRPIRNAKRYSASSDEHYSNAKNASAQQMQRYLQLPANSNPRTQAWAQSLRAQFFGAANGAVIQGAAAPLQESPERQRLLIDHVLQTLRQDDYHYTLEPGVYGANAADEFWFDRKAGFCEHIASAFAIAMRAAGIPARIVTGYQGGEATALDKEVITVRQSDAHAWTEVWLEGVGWLRIDPTAAIAPERISLSRSQAFEQGGLAANGRTPTGAAWLWGMRSAMEAIDYRWAQWVVNYNRTEQASLFAQLGLERLNWPQILWLALALLGVTTLAYFAATRWRAQRRVDPWLRLLATAQIALQSKGVNMESTDAPLTMAQKTRAAWGHEAEPIEKWLLHMDALRYAAPKPNAKVELKALSDRWKKMQWPTANPRHEPR